MTPRSFSPPAEPNPTRRRSFPHSRRSRERNQIITTVVEHPAILALCEHLEKEGTVVHRLKVDKKGRLDIDEYKSLLSPRTAIVSVMWANNETGTLFPVEQMAAMARSVGAMFHTDAVQAVGKVPIDLKTTKIDMLSLSGHKLHAPKGIGVLYLRRNTRFRPLLRGGHQERGRRAEHREFGIHRRTRQGGRAGAGIHGVREHRDQGPARPAGGRDPGTGAARVRHWRSGQTACRTRPTSPSNTSRARPFCCCSTSRASPLPAVQPALRDHWNRRT